MSAATKEVLARVRQMIPPMLESFHKGAYVCFFRYFLIARERFEMSMMRYVYDVLVHVVGWMLTDHSL